MQRLSTGRVRQLNPQYPVVQIRQQIRAPPLYLRDNDHVQTYFPPTAISLPGFE